jgi:Protein of unknown function (DUF3551)
MRTLAAVVTIAILLLIDARGPLQAAPWCAWFIDNDYSHDCAYYTLPQCVATIRGVGGYCARNVYPELLPYPPPPYRKRHSRRYD